MKPILEIKNIGKQYRLLGHSQPYLSLRENLSQLFTAEKSEDQFFWALEDISFNVQPGDSLAIIGRNGAGKSTLLKILSKITPPTKGKIIARGRVASLLEVGTGFHPELSGRENIFLNGSILGLTKSEIKNQFDAIVDFSGVEKFMDTALKHYSSGMQLRLAFSVAAHLEPEILIIDEVLAVGDFEFQRRCLGKMDEVSKSGRTIIFVSHNMGAVKSLCNRAVLLEHGKKIVEGSSEDIVSAYLSRADLLNKISLRDRKDRTGSGEAKFTSIKLLDRSSKLEVTELISGHAADIEIEIEKTEGFDQVIEELEIGLSIFNAEEQFVTVVNNKMSNFKFSKIEGGNWKVTCGLDAVPLMYGKFSILASMILNFKVSDIVHAAHSFIVEPGDFYHSNHPNHFKRQGVYIPQRWEIESKS